MINLLGIGLDYMMLEKDPVRGDVWQRQKTYAEDLDKFYLVIYGPRKRAKYRRFDGDEKVTVIPTDSRSKATFFWDALKRGWKVCKKNEIGAMTAEDPFITGLVGLVLKKRFKVPLNVQIHADIFDNPYWMRLRLINRIFNRLAKFVARRADSIRIGTHYEKEKVSKMLGIPAERINVIPVSADVQKFSVEADYGERKELLSDLGLERFNSLIVSVGRLKHQKDFPTLIRAMDKIRRSSPDTALCILGEGPEREKIMAEVEKYGLADNVFLVGSVSHEEVARYLAACDVYVMPSIYEGTCIALAEACIAGKPVVSTAFAGAYDLILDGKTGYRVPIKDAEAIADRVIYLLNHSDEARMMGIKARDHVKEMFSEDHNVRGVVRMWKKTADSGVLC